MKRILLTTTSLVMAAGAANADITWSGAATAGIARTGEVAAVAQSKQGTAAGAAAIADTDDTVDSTNAATKTGTSTDSITTTAHYEANLIAQVKADLAIIEGVLDDTDNTATELTMSGGTTEALLRTDIANLKALAALGYSDAGSASTDIAAQIIKINESEAMLDAWFGTDATATGDWDTYSEINATATASIAMDNGMTLSVSASVDAGIGYDFADDDGFDAAKTNGVGLDSISLDMGSMGKLTLDEDNIAHLVDGDDDVAGDVSYTNTFGTASFSLVADMDKDGDAKAVKGSTTVAWVDGVDTVAKGADVAGYTKTTIVDAVAADVAWSGKISMPLAGGSGYIAMDEEGGNAFGATATLSGVGISFDSKLEALEEEIKADRSNTVGLTYAMGATTFGATWNSVEDGDQWGISAAYAADGLSISASTDEGSDWSVSGSMAMGGGASLTAGVNYTEDAYVGVSFAF